MAQQMITLEEAAEKLGISPEEMKKRLKTDPDFKRLSQIRDGANVRFKLSAIEELARLLGMASDQDLPLAPVDEEPPGSDDFKVKSGDKKKSKKDEDLPLEFDSSENDVFSLADEPKAATPKPKSSGKLTPEKPKSTPKVMSDSSAAESDSDVRLDGDKPPKPKDQGGVPTEEISLDFSGPGSAVIKGGSSAKLSAPKPPSSGKLAASDPNKSGKPPAPPDSSEFELSLDADSDDFEMQMNPDSADEVDLGTMPDKGNAPSSGRASKSGINLRDPKDSGIVLEKGKDKTDEESKDGEGSGDSEPDFELSLDSSAIASSTKLGAPKSGKLVLDADSDSEFELTLDDSGGSSLEHAALDSAADESADKGDIFETDFEIPPMPDESGSEAVALESDTDLEKSDFVTDENEVLSEEPSESEVVLLGDEDEAPKSSAKLKSKVGRKPATEEADVEVEVADDEEDASISKALKGAKGKRREDDDEDEEAKVSPAATIVERPTKPWGIVPLLFLAPAILVVFLGALMGFETLNTMTSYQQPRKPASPLIRSIASNFDMELRDQ
jgi:hypothetical protein